MMVEYELVTVITKMSQETIICQASWTFQGNSRYCHSTCSLKKVVDVISNETDLVLGVLAVLYPVVSCVGKDQNHSEWQLSLSEYSRQYHVT